MAARDLLTLSHSALLDLFEVNLNPIGHSLILRFCNYSQSNGTDVSFAGKQYQAYPIQATGFEKAVSGTLPSPEISVSNVFSDISGLILTYGGMLDAQVTRLKVLAKNLDGQPGANPNEIEDYSVWYISRYQENSLVAKFTLRSPMDVNKLQLPRRRMAALLD